MLYPPVSCQEEGIKRGEAINKQLLKRGKSDKKSALIGGRTSDFPQGAVKNLEKQSFGKNWKCCLYPHLYIN
jgi:hypothetical protein